MKFIFSERPLQDSVLLSFSRVTFLMSGTVSNFHILELLLGFLNQVPLTVTNYLLLCYSIEVSILQIQTVKEKNAIIIDN